VMITSAVGGRHESAQEIHVRSLASAAPPVRCPHASHCLL
jgi:hypothetical protein